ncbi:ubiquitin-conjugating enzyme E2 U-like [Clupea harengus]|uniref:Ubiquitin-conjugating enzyme E2 U-like n=1 Tax=Clupea harengus TaxID=7950 RepID=A0A6P3VIV1_CLUHA|nr:ubiquitin-conjugating enzyme E2 U-like [Clupea harengus]
MFQVDKDTGEVCISFPHSRNEWDLNTSAVSILRFIQHVLSHPDLEDPVNLEAAEMFLNRPNAYREVVEQCVKTSQALEREDMGVTEANPGKPLRSDRVVRRISFEEYLQAWTATATTKAGPLMANESLDKLVSSAQMLAHRCGSPTHVVVPFSEASLKTQV